MLKFVELCHSFGIKIIPYCSSSYIDVRSKDYRPEFTRTGKAEHTFINMHVHYTVGCASSAEWRNFIIPRTMNIMDTYGFDGIFNDWGYDWDRSTYRAIPPDRRNYEKEPLERYDPEAEDLVHMLYDGVHERGGIYRDFEARALAQRVPVAPKSFKK